MKIFQLQQTQINLGFILAGTGSLVQIGAAARTETPAIRFAEWIIHLAENKKLANIFIQVKMCIRDRH